MAVLLRARIGVQAIPRTVPRWSQVAQELSQGWRLGCGIGRRLMGRIGGYMEQKRADCRSAGDRSGSGVQPSCI